MKTNDLKSECKIWLSKQNGDYVIGGGGAKLLDAIDKARDLGKAAELLGISYRKSWNILQKIKKNSGENPVITHRGGKGGGGGMELSETGKILLKSYKKFENYIEKAISEFEN
ncbi:MAG: ModE family transcriptional regulator [archaeon]|nr:ModE family transcriptional regulator [archaeon]